MVFASSHRFPRALLLSCLALGLSLAAGQPVSAEPQRIAFSHKNFSDLRGILNVFDTFRTACLAQPVTQGLDERLLPEGYRIVSSSLHALGFETSNGHTAVVLSRTGDEEKDFAGGHPYVELGRPNDTAPNGTCRIVWKRAWDYADGIEKIMTGTAVLFDPWLSFQLKAVRVSRPEDGFAVAERYDLLSEWAAPCFGGTWCRLETLLILNRKDGIHLTIKRGDPPSASGGKN